VRSSAAVHGRRDEFERGVFELAKNDLVTTRRLNGPLDRSQYGYVASFRISAQGNVEIERR